MVDKTTTKKGKPVKPKGKAKSKKPKQKPIISQTVRQVVNITQPVKRIYKKSGSEKTQSKTGLSSSPYPVYVPQYLPQQSITMSDVMNAIKAENAPIKQSVKGLPERPRLVENAPIEDAMSVKVVKSMEGLKREEPTKRVVFGFPALPMEESIPSIKPISKNIQISKPISQTIKTDVKIEEPTSSDKMVNFLPMEITPVRPIAENVGDESVNIRNTLPIKRQLTKESMMIKKPKPELSEYTPSIMSELPFYEETFPILSRKGMDKDTTLKIIALNEGKTLKQVKKEYQAERKTNPKGVLGKYRDKAIQYQQRPRFDEL